MRRQRIAVALLTTAGLLGFLPRDAATAQPAVPLPHVRVLAVAPFADEVGMRALLARWTATRLAQLLEAKGWQVVPVERAEQRLREMGLDAFRLISPTATAELGRRLGADAVVTGRLLRADVDGQNRLPPIGPPGEIPEGPPEGYVTLDLRILSVHSRSVLIQREVAGHSFGLFPLQVAAELALRHFLAQVAPAPRGAGLHMTLAGGRSCSRTSMRS